MTSGRLLWILGFAFAATACLGGQSGVEGDLPGRGCWDASPQSVGLDEVTSLGTARSLLDSLRTPQLAKLSWYPQDATSAPVVDTTLTLSVTGEPERASYIASQVVDCLPMLQVTGGTLRFETADGAFQESFPGVASHSAKGDSFDATLPTSQFAGTYDVASAAKLFRNPYLSLQTSLSPAQGSLSVSGDSKSPGGVAGATRIADWTGAGN